MVFAIFAAILVTALVWSTITGPTYTVPDAPDPDPYPWVQDNLDP